MTLVSESVPAEPYLLADHPALDLLNTEAEVEGKPFDFWKTGDDVFRWLIRSGFLDENANRPADMDTFLLKAKALRAAARELVEKRKKGQLASPDKLNAFLREFQRHPVLEWRSKDEIYLSWQPVNETPGQLLGAVAESVARLLAEADFDLVRQCEHPECIMWFYDRTKAHRRKWCSMALCGNRHKVSAHRKRMASA